MVQIWKVLGVGTHHNREHQPSIPVLIYVLLARSQGIADPRDAMHLSLKFIKEIDEVQALVLLPWMTITRGQDWRQLPNPRRT